MNTQYAPLNLHGPQFSGAFDDGFFGIDTFGSAIRTGASSGNTVGYSLGNFALTGGFWLEIQLIDTSIVISKISVTFN